MRELKEANDATSNESHHQRSKTLRRSADGVVVLRAQLETSGKTQLVRRTNVTDVAAAPLPVPVITIALLDTAVPAATLILTDVEKVPDETGLEPNVSDTPAGTPDTARVTGPANPPPRAMESPALPMPPAATVALPGRSVSAIVPATTGSTTVLPLLPLLHALIPAATQSANPARTIEREWTANDMAEAK